MSEPRDGGGPPADPSRFQFTGGLLERSIYVERPADRLLPEALLSGEYCHILAPRQIGKTSLCFRAARELARRGVRCALVDVTAAGTPSTAEEWYFGLVDEIARRLRMPDPLDDWQRRPGVAPAQRFRDFMRGLVEGDSNRAPLVVFLDEIEMVRLAPVDVDDFLLMLRSFHEERGQSPALGRLSFCLIGVTTPNDLIKNKSVTPFNVSRPIRVDDFTRAECDGLAPGLAGLDASPTALLDAVYGWTDGHPYMTMRACFELARQKKVTRGAEQAAADDVVRDLFLDRPLEDTNINYAARRFEDPRFERDGARLADKIQLYRRVLAHKDPPAHNESAVQMELRICGMVKDVEVTPGRRVLRSRNHIYERALDTEWLRSKGERRFVSEAVWKWLDAGKDEAALLRGVVLEKALSWAATNVLSEDEQAFLDASQKHATQSLERERVRITQEVVATDEELTKARDALAKATSDKTAAEAARETLAEQQANLKATLRKTKRLVSLAVSGIALAAVLAGLAVWRTTSALNQQQMSTGLLESQARLAKQEKEDADREREAALLDKETAEAAQQEAERKLEDLEEQKKLVKQYVDDNKDLKQKTDDLTAENTRLADQNARLDRDKKQLEQDKLQLEKTRALLETTKTQLQEDVTKLRASERDARTQLAGCQATVAKLGRQKFATPP